MILMCFGFQSDRVGDQFLKYIKEYTPSSNCSSCDDAENADDAVNVVQRDVCDLCSVIRNAFYGLLLELLNKGFFPLMHYYSSS